MNTKDVDLTDLLKLAIHKSAVDIKVALPARVISFNPQLQTATIEVMLNHVFQDGLEKEVTPLLDVPVTFMRGGGFCMTCPISAGDEGTALFHDRCIDGWFDTGGKGAPIDHRLHDFSDAQFIPGISSKNKVIPDFFMGGASMQTDDGSTYIRLSKGKIAIKGDIEHVGNATQQGNMNRAGSSMTSGTSSAQDFKAASGMNLTTHTHSGIQRGDSQTDKGQG